MIPAIPPEASSNPDPEPFSPEELAQTAALIAASENGPCCSGEEPPDPTFEQIEAAREFLRTRAKLGPVH